MLNFKDLKTNFFLVQAIIIVICTFVTFLVMGMTDNLPDADFIETTEPEQSTQVFDINDRLIAEINEDEGRICVSFDEVSPFFTSAVIAIEDVRFYEHKGVDLKGTIRAFLNNMACASSIQGGSTITQQLVKNWYLMPERSFKRKFLEALLAVKVENKLSKKEIIEKYMNLIYLGNRSYGIEKAANRYFNKKAKDLNLAEAALLAGLIKAPEQYSPYSNLKESLKRQKIVLDRMLEFGYITEKQRKNALNTHLKFEEPKIAVYNKYPYFVDYVSQLLRERYGKEVVDRGGLKVYTTLDPGAQEAAEKTINEGVKKLSAYTGIRQGALVTIDVKTGYVKALVGGIDYSKSQFNRATMAQRATGSGFKPIVYLTGLRLGIITPDTYIMDAPIAYRTKWNVWTPHNWDGKYMGRMTVRKALTLSRNTPTVRVALQAGIDNVIETARLLGIRSHIDRGYSIVLGSAGLTPIEVATAYSTLAREGVYLEPTAIRYLTDSRGNLIESANNKPVRVVDSKYVRLLNSILIDVVQKGTGKNAILEGREIAGKTGTTDDFKDIWFSGYTPDTVTTIWMGNDESTQLRGVFSSNCATLWKNFSQEYYKKNNIIAQSFRAPEKEVLEKLRKEKKKEKIASQPNIKPPPVPQAAPPRQPQVAVQQQLRPKVVQKPQTYTPPAQPVQPMQARPQYQQQPYYPPQPQYQQQPVYPQYQQQPQYQQRPYYPPQPQRPQYPQQYPYYNR